MIGGRERPPPPKETGRHGGRPEGVIPGETQRHISAYMAVCTVPAVDPLIAWHRLADGVRARQRRYRRRSGR
jgi:hypothetical protein